MPGSVEQGFPTPPEPERVVESESDGGDGVVEATTYVKIETPFYSGEAISLFDMPWDHVLDMMTEPGPGQVRKLILLLKVALPEEGWAQVELLGFRQMLEVVADWAARSQPEVSVTLDFGG